ncbi:MAG: tetratricopeptide repeat protein [Phormidesmis sp. RL_2_1]|nr:tetratricopeptide repeat protein [Phormidesmis sp. RL_2_1]
MRLSPAGQRFFQEVQKADGRINLAAAALYIAQEAYWDIDPKHYLGILDDMAADVRSRLPKGRYPLKVIQIINHYLFEELKFSGNERDYYNPDNSCLNCVIDRRLGIPITLSLVYLELAHRLRFPMVGIGMPGHFLIRPVIDEMEIFVDPFHHGEVLFVADCQEQFQRLYGSQDSWRPEFLNGVLPKAFLARILLNLKWVYMKLEAYDDAVAALDKLLILAPRQYQEVRDRGLLHYELKNYDLAKQDLEVYLRSQPKAPDGPKIQQLLDRLS